jgi:hypothetical protein
MATHGTTHWDVAAYALGVLDPREVEQCEAHLATCPSCVAELESVLPATRLLADVDIDSLREAEESQLVDRLIDTVRTERHRARSRRRAVAAAGTTVAAVVAGVALFAGASWLGATPISELAGGPSPSAIPSPTTEAPTGVGGPDVDIDEFSAIDTTTGAQAEVLLEATDWGTQVSLALSSVTGPLECQLLLVRADGTTELVGSWLVPLDGYGTQAQPDPLLVQVPTATDRDELTKLLVQATDLDGATTPLVAVSL